MKFDFESLRKQSPILLRGSDTACYRDPAVLYKDGTFYIYFSYCTTDAPDHGSTCYLQLGMTTTQDLHNFTPVRTLTPKDTRLNFSSPGDIVFWNGEFHLCCQTYCRENGEKYGNARSRLWLMSSKDLFHWSEPRIMRVKGDDVAIEDMGRMIDAFLYQNDDGDWFCFYKQNGVSFSKSKDLEHWTFMGRADSGENVCVIKDGSTYRLWDSPANGIGEKTSTDLIHWQDTGRLLTFGQQDWPWAQGRLTAGFVLDLRDNPDFGKAFMFFHGTGPKSEASIFNQYSCLSVAWSDDLVTWDYPRGDFDGWQVNPERCTGF